VGETLHVQVMASVGATPTLGVRMNRRVGTKGIAIYRHIGGGFDLLAGKGHIHTILPYFPSCGGLFTGRVKEQNRF